MSEQYVSEQYVFVLTETIYDDSTTSVIGVYETHAAAEAEKFAIIRDYFDIDESEVPDADLEDEVSDSVGYEIVQRKVQR
jgi:hypothetical protein